MEAILQPLKGMACKCTHSLLPSSVPRSPPSDVWMKPRRGGGKMRDGGGERIMWWRRGRQFLCVLWSLSYGFSLSGLSPGTLMESGSGRHPHSQNPRPSSRIQPGKSLYTEKSSQHNLWPSDSDMWLRHNNMHIHNPVYGLSTYIWG